MATYEVIPTLRLSKDNELISPVRDLPELVHLYDPAQHVFIDFAKTLPITTSPNTAIDNAIDEMKRHHVHTLLVAHEGKIVGVISYEEMVGERPLKILQEKRLSRTEVTVKMLMKTWDQILVIDYSNLKNAQVGHIINTIKKHNVSYLLVVKRVKGDKHLIRGIFSVSQIGKQLHADLSAILFKEPETIIELHKERKV